MAFVKSALKRAYRRLPIGGALAVLMLTAVVAAVSQDEADAKKSDIIPPAAPAAEPLWSKECVQRPNGTPLCYVQQFAISQQQKAVVLRVQVGYMGPPDGQPRVLITAPLGIALQAGIRLTLDNDNPLVLPVQSCRKEGCETLAVLGKDVIGKFMTGKLMVVRYVYADRGPLDIPIRLDGLDSALKALQDNSH
jgi:invasion protein IalB